MDGGKVIIFSAPSGSGKTTLVNHLLSKYPNLAFSISACTRAPRKGETHGKDYYFLEPEDFKNRIKAGEFVEWEEVYNNSFYGTLIAEVQRIWDDGKVVLFDVDVKGGVNLKKYFADQALAVFVKVPTMEVLEERLKGRGSETPESLAARLDKAAYELEFERLFDVSIINDELEQAKKEAEQLISKFIESGE